MKVIQLENISSDLLLAHFEGLQFQLDQLEKNINVHLKSKTPPEYLTRKDVAKLLSISLVTLNDWRKKGILKAYKIGNRVYFKRKEIEAAMTEISKGR
ncbi:MAG: helix-turn-helix domain-containing protein [Bacteroidota bacterium]